MKTTTAFKKKLKRKSNKKRFYFHNNVHTLCLQLARLVFEIRCLLLALELGFELELVKLCSSKKKEAINKSNYEQLCVFSFPK